MGADGVVTKGRPCRTRDSDKTKLPKARGKAAKQQQSRPGIASFLGHFEKQPSEHFPFSKLLQSRRVLPTRRDPRVRLASVKASPRWNSTPKKPR